MVSISTPTRTSLLPPSPLRLGQALTATVAVFGRRPLLFISLALLPGMAVGLVAVIGAVVATILLLSAEGSTLWHTEWTPAVTAQVSAITLVVALIAPLIQIKGQGLMVLLAHETALDRRPTVSDVLSGTRGVVVRSLGLIAAAVLLLPAVGLVAGLVTGATVGDGTARWSAPWPPVAGGVALTALATWAMARLLYVPQGVTLERLGGLRSLAYSWRLSGQAPARTLGWWLGGPVLGSLACWVMAVALATLMGAGPFTAMTASAAAAALLAYLAAYTLSTLLTAIFTTVMHVDQRRRQG